MKIKCVMNLPLEWFGPEIKGLTAQTNIRAHSKSRLLAKVLVFDTQPDLRAFWISHHGKGYDIGEDCLAVVNQLSYTILNVQPKGSKKPDTETLCVDKRFFCMMGFTRGRMGVRVLTHECVHAAFAYAVRKHKSPWDKHATDNDEETISYPAGEIAREIVLWMDRIKLP